MGFGKYHIRDTLFSLHHIIGYMILMCLINGDVNLDHLVKVVFATFLHCKDTMFLFHTLSVRSESLNPAHNQGEGN